MSPSRKRASLFLLLFEEFQPFIDGFNIKLERGTYDLAPAQPIDLLIQSCDQKPTIFGISMEILESICIGKMHISDL